MSTDLKGELASLKIDRNRKAASPWRWPLLLFVPVLARPWACSTRCGPARPSPRPRWRRSRPPSRRARQADAGTPVLSASGYVVARRKAVVSAKIQGRLSGSGSRRAAACARARSSRASRAPTTRPVQRAKAAVQRAEADLAESQRQLRLAEDLTRQSIWARTSATRPRPG